MSGRQVGRVGCLFVAAVLLGAGLTVGAYKTSDKRNRAEKLDDSLNGETPIQPVWIRLNRPCDGVSAKQKAQDDAMLNVALAFDGPGHVTGLQYAFKYFGWHWRISAGNEGRCPPAANYYAQLAPVVDRAGWPTLRPDSQFDLNLAERLPPGRQLAARLAKLAFNPYQVTIEPLDYDIRPYARMLLAEQGKYARPWKAQALSEIAAETKLGTSAAYLAVAVAPEEALPRVEKAMREMTLLALSRKASNPDEQGISMRDGFRLYELAYALSMAGSKAEPYSDPLIRLLNEKFATGSHFGMLMLNPVALCGVARHIGGRAALAANAKPFCNEPRSSKTPFP